MGREPIQRATLADGTRVYRVRVDVQPYPDGRRRQANRTFRTLAEARAALTEIRAAVRTDTFVPRNTVTLQQHFDAWLAGRRNIRNTTRDNYRNITRQFMAEYGSLPLGRIDKPLLDDYVTRLMTTGGRSGKGHSPSSVRGFVVAMRQVLDLAVKERLIPVNPARLVEVPAQELPRHDIWTDAQAQAFLAVAADHHLYPCWMLTMAGLRRGEVLGLSWDHVDLEAKTLRIEATRVLVDSQPEPSLPKTRRGYRTLPIWPALEDALAQHRRSQIRTLLAHGLAQAGLVATWEDGTPVHPRSYSDTFKALARKAKIPVIPLKNARHTSVTLMRSQGVPDDIVATWHGHDESIMRGVYTQTTLSRLTAAADFQKRLS